MTSKAPTALDLPASAPTAPPVAPAPPANRFPFAIAARILATGLLLVLYFVFYTQILDLFAAGFRSLAAATAPAPSRVAAVTMLGLLLAALWWKVIKSDVRFHAPILITYILAVGDATYGILENHTSEWLSALTNGRVTSYSPTFIAILA